MKIRASNPALRKIIVLLSVCTFASLFLHFVLLPQRYLKNLKSESSKEYTKTKKESNTAVKIPEEYLQNFSNISPHDYKYIIRPDTEKICSYRQPERLNEGNSKKRLLILFIVHSKAEHFEHRNAIRETWGSIAKRLTQVVFLLGDPKNVTLQGMVNDENRKFGDLVQEDFFETYRNITLKNIMGLKWASQRCPHAKYVVKTDDDMFVNSKMLISTLINSRLPKKDLIICKIHFFKNVPREGKYVIARSLYEEDYWPSFCFGGCWIASMDVVRRLFDVSLKTKQIYLDDVYVTGILRTKLSIPLNYISRAYMIFCHTRGNHTMVRKMWNDMEASRINKMSIDGIQRQNEPYVKFWARCFT
uniref:beta-1,3-galactosyltransferase 1-like isoform X1 n=1 Tax=Styela clava TaxID=7725 RepID=UPI00193AA71F|nr:beta-1,3-galactosyltransferase 1-like isoform X1 [Styela clava]